MTHEELSNFTHEELSFLKHMQLSQNEMDTLIQLKNSDASVPDSVIQKLKQLCGIIDNETKSTSCMEQFTKYFTNEPAKTKSLISFCMNLYKITNGDSDLSSLVPVIQQKLIELWHMFLKLIN